MYRGISNDSDRMIVSMGSSSQIKKRAIISHAMGKIFLAMTLSALFILGVLLYRIARDSVGWLDMSFLTGRLSIVPDKAGIAGVITGTFLLMAVVVPVTVIIGAATAIYLEEYARKGKIEMIIRTNISNLAGVPSVIFGLLGLTVFGRMFDLGASVLAGGLTMSLLVLPIVVMASQEALKAVPGFLREASYAMGATKWITIRKVVVPAAMPGILTGTILALSRAIGETAPLIVLGIPAFILRTPHGLMDDFTALPVQIYYWTLDTVLTKEYANLAAAAIVMLLILLFLMNSAAIVIRNKFQRRF
jgi:phosphate transport system permease protein